MYWLVGETNRQSAFEPEACQHVATFLWSKQVPDQTVFLPTSFELLGVPSFDGCNFTEHPSIMSGSCAFDPATKSGQRRPRAGVLKCLLLLLLLQPQGSTEGRAWWRLNAEPAAASTISTSMVNQSLPYRQLNTDHG
jgi:hypothetical protein